MTDYKYYAVSYIQSDLDYLIHITDLTSVVVQSLTSPDYLSLSVYHTISDLFIVHILLSDLTSTVYISVIDLTSIDCILVSDLAGHPYLYCLYF